MHLFLQRGNDWSATALLCILFPKESMREDTVLLKKEKMITLHIISTLLMQIHQYKCRVAHISPLFSRAEGEDKKQRGKKKAAPESKG